MSSLRINSHQLILILVGILLTFSFAGPRISPVEAQGPTCPAIVEQALAALENNCTDTGRNSACYGYNQVRAAFSDPVAEDFFTLPADKAGLTTLASLSTTAMDVDSERWGIALMNAQANVPNSLPGQEVTFLLLGETAIENRVDPNSALEPIDPVDVSVRSNQGVNVRSGPGTNFNVIAVAQPGAVLPADGLNNAGDWLRVLVDETPGWISRSLTSSTDEAAVDALPAIEDDVFAPMQAFYFSTGIGQSTCNEAPDTLVIQGPQSFEVNLNVNGAEVVIGSTIALSSGVGNAAPAPIDSPFGQGSSAVVLNQSVYLVPVDENSLIIALGDTPTGDSFPLDEGVYIHPISAEGLRITLGPDDEVGINNPGRMFADIEAANLLLNLTAEAMDGILVEGRVFIGPAPGGGVMLATESGDISSLGSSSVPEAPSEDEDNCRETELIVIDGEALLNQGALNIPIGHRAIMKTCFDEEGNIISEDWEEGEPLTEEELRRRFGTLENIPPGLLNYPIEIPTDEEIEDASRPPAPPPSTGNTGNTGNTGSTGGTTTCSGLVGTSPTDGMAFGRQTFYWNGIENVDFYRVVVTATDRPGQVFGDVGAPVTNLTLDMGVGALGQFGRGLNFQWRVQAWKDNAVTCESAAIFQQREFISPEALCPLLGGSWDGECYGQTGVIPIPD